MRTRYISSKSFSPPLQFLSFSIWIPGLWSRQRLPHCSEMRCELEAEFKWHPLLNVTSTRSITIMVSTPSVLPNNIPSLFWSLLCYWDITKTEREIMSTMYLKLKQLKPLTAPDFPTLLFFFFVHFANLNLLMLVMSDVWCHIKTRSMMRAHI